MDKKELLYRIRLALVYKDVLLNAIPFLQKRYVARFQKSQKLAAQRLVNKERIEVAFQLTTPSIWKWDYLFQKMQDDPRYHPYIIITPFTWYRHNDPEEVDNMVERTRHFVDSKGYDYIVPYDSRRRKWIRLDKACKPDIIFFAAPYKDTPSQYYIYRFRHTLTCYAAYGFVSMQDYLRLNYGLTFASLVGAYFVESPIHRSLASGFSKCNASNIVVTGYPGTEIFLCPDYTPTNPWKPQEKTKRRIIWAPHHTIDGGGDLSTFLLYCDDMIRLAQKYFDCVQFAFKPHHVLKLKLHKLWGEERTEEYYRQWREMENTQLEEGDYIDLFLTSDAIMHDCGSFTTEYLFTRKPAMYLMRDENMDNRFNDFGKLAFEQYYKGHNLADIEHFIAQVVVAGDDPMASQRDRFYNDYLYSDQMPSERILAAIKDMINKE